MTEREKEVVFFEDITGYGFILMLIFILMAINLFIVVIPVTIFFIWKLIRKAFKKIDDFIIW